MSHAISRPSCLTRALSFMHRHEGYGPLSGGAKMPDQSGLCCGVMGLSGVPFMSGFFSKDMILPAPFSKARVHSIGIGGIGSALTVVYFWSAYIKVFHGTVSRSGSVRSRGTAVDGNPHGNPRALTLLARHRSREQAIGACGSRYGDPHRVPTRTWLRRPCERCLPDIRRGPVIGLALVRGANEYGHGWSHAAGLVSFCRQGFY